MTGCSNQCGECQVRADLEYLQGKCLACVNGDPPPDRRGQLTPLPEDVEERILSWLKDLSSLPALKALLLLHILGGGTIPNFGDSMQALAWDLSKYGCRPSRQLVRTWWLDLEARLGWVGSLRGWKPRGRDGGRRPGGSAPGRFCDPQKDKAQPATVLISPQVETFKGEENENGQA